MIIINQILTQTIKVYKFSHVMLQIVDRMSAKFFYIDFWQ